MRTININTRNEWFSWVINSFTLGIIVQMKCNIIFIFFLLIPLKKKKKKKKKIYIYIYIINIHYNIKIFLLYIYNIFNKQNPYLN